jgi:hypothetical protein
MAQKFGGHDLVTSRSGYTGRVMATYPGDSGREIMVKGVPDARTGLSPEPRVFTEKALRVVSFG